MPEKRILLVEDDENVGELLALTLADAGYEVDVARLRPNPGPASRRRAIRSSSPIGGCRMATARSLPMAQPILARRLSS
jgi:DNA-binding NtrC family response regulator